MFGLGRFEELLIILVIILVLFGGKKLPELSRGFSDSIREIRKGFKDKDDEPDDKKKIAKTKEKSAK
jgi:sec-independent protein translocase protein TatA